MILDEALDGGAGEIWQAYCRDNTNPFAAPDAKHRAEGKYERAHASIY